MSTTYEAIWAFREDLQAMKESFREEFEAHISQRLGTPLRRYEGQLSIDDEGVSLIGKSKDAQEEFSLFVPFKAVLDVYLGWDDVLNRWKDTRALIKPLRINFKAQEKKSIYIYGKKAGAKIYGRENKALYEKLTIKAKGNQ
jgi:hypothetical protein